MGLAPVTVDLGPELLVCVATHDPGAIGEVADFRTPKLLNRTPSSPFRISAAGRDVAIDPSTRTGAVQGDRVERDCVRQRPFLGMHEGSRCGATRPDLRREVSTRPAYSGRRC